MSSNPYGPDAPKYADYLADTGRTPAQSLVVSYMGLVVMFGGDDQDWTVMAVNQTWDVIAYRCDCSGDSDMAAYVFGRWTGEDWNPPE